MSDTSPDSNDLANRPVALLHGLGGSAADTWQGNGWVDLISDAGRPALGIDLLGHGTAPKPHEPDAYLAMHEHVLSQLPETPVDAIGFSLGAMTLLRCALAEPERFSRLVLTGIGGNVFEPSAHHQMIIDAIDGVGDPNDPFTRYFANLADNPDADPDALKALVSSGGERLTPEQVGAITIPVLVLLGDGDFNCPADPLVAALPNATFSELKRCDHFATPRSMQCLDEALAFVDASPF
jgi:pimeloyl-ACP methyl ester carboxylesterase